MEQKPPIGYRIATSIVAKAANLKDSSGNPMPKVPGHIVGGQYFRTRILYRVARSQECDPKFVLKGGMLHLLAEGLGTSRPTSDIDIHAHEDVDDLDNVMKFILESDYYDEEGLVEDGLSIESVTPEGLQHSGGEGRRYWVRGKIGELAVSTHIDVGFGGVRPHDLEWRELSTFGQKIHTTQMLCYPDHYVVAEKLHAVQVHGMANTRVRDFYDLRNMLRNGRVDAHKVVKALVKTHLERGTWVDAAPVGLTEAFGVAQEKNWTTWHNRQGVRRDGSLADCVAEVGDFYRNLLTRARDAVAGPSARPSTAECARHPA
jgi:hypothetical protein